MTLLRLALEQTCEAHEHAIDLEGSALVPIHNLY
jgi:hypothetical protein